MSLQNLTTFQIGSLSILVIGVFGFIATIQFDRGTLIQEGKINIQNFNFAVSFPIPYASDPYVELPRNFDAREISYSRTGFYGRLTSYSSGSDYVWRAEGVADKTLDPRPFFQRLTFVERGFAIVGFIGSICSIISIFR